MKMNRLMKNKNSDKMGKAVFIIPVAAIAMILIACIVVAVTASHGKNDQLKNDKTKQDISNAGNSSIANLDQDNSEPKKADKSVSGVIRNTAYDIKEIVRKAENDAIELAKQEEIKASNAADSGAETNVEPKDTGSTDASSAEGDAAGEGKVSDGGKDKGSSGNNNPSGGTKSSGSTTSSDNNSGNSGGSGNNNSPSQGGSIANEPAKSEQPKNEYVAPGWIYYGSKAGNGMTGDQKAYLDSVIKQWTNGGLSNSYIEDLFLEKIDQEWGLPMSTAGVTSGQRCLYPSLGEVPDYGENLAEVGGAYNFMGLYTKGEYDEYGYLICYYWEAGVL